MELMPFVTDVGKYVVPTFNMNCDLLVPDKRRLGEIYCFTVIAIADFIIRVLREKWNVAPFETSYNIKYFRNYSEYCEHTPELPKGLYPELVSRVCGIYINVEELVPYPDKDSTFTIDDVAKFDVIYGMDAIMGSLAVTSPTGFNYEMVAQLGFPEDGSVRVIRVEDGQIANLGVPYAFMAMKELNPVMSNGSVSLEAFLEKLYTVIQETKTD